MTRHKVWHIVRRTSAAAAASTVAIIAVSIVPAFACAGLVTPSGNVKVESTTTLAAYHGGIEHYITAFSFQGGGAEFGSIVPLPNRPTKIERGGDWTLQRLQREKNRAFSRGVAQTAAASASAGTAVVIEQKRIDALNITVLKGGGTAVGRWAREHGFKLTPDAPAVLDFYGDRSPYFLAAVFDAKAAAERGQQRGEGTPVHLTIPTSNPWVPLRILGLGRPAPERINASVFLLTDGKPTLLHGNTPGIRISLDEPASASLLTDLRSDKGMEWLPTRMYVMAVDLFEERGRLTYDLAADVTSKASPSPVAAGLIPPTTTTTTARPTTTSTVATTTSPPTTAAPTTTTVAETHSVALAAQPAEPPSHVRQWVAAGVAALLVPSVAIAAAWIRRRRVIS